MIYMISKFVLSILDKAYDLKELLVRYYNYRFEMKSGYWKDKDIYKRKNDNF